MNQRKIFLILFLTSITFQLKSQDSEATQELPWLKLIHIEAHTLFPSSVLKENIPIRQTVSNYNQYDNYDYNNSKITLSTLSQAYAVKAEFYNKAYKIGISTGIKYCLYQSNVEGNVAPKANYFFFRYSSEGQETKFARVSQLLEKNHYIVIPIDARIFVLNRKKFGFFARIGTDIGYNLYNKLNVVFYNPDMSASKNDVLNVIDKTQEKFYATINTSLGIRYNYFEKVSFNFEVYLPSKYLGNDYFILSDLKRFFGFKASVQVPLTLFNIK